MGALDLYAAQRKEQIENGPFSEPFYLDPTGARTEVMGIYDEPYLAGDKDTGNVRQQLRKPRVLIDTVPSGVIPQTTKIEVRSGVYTVQKIDRDPEGVPRMWLL